MYKWIFKREPKWGEWKICRSWPHLVMAFVMRDFTSYCCSPSAAKMVPRYLNLNTFSVSLSIHQMLGHCFCCFFSFSTLGPLYPRAVQRPANTYCFLLCHGLLYNEFWWPLRFWMAGHKSRIGEASRTLTCRLLVRSLWSPPDECVTLVPRCCLRLKSPSTWWGILCEVSNRNVPFLRLFFKTVLWSMLFDPRLWLSAKKDLLIRTCFEGNTVNWRRPRKT